MSVNLGWFLLTTLVAAAPQPTTAEQQTAAEPVFGEVLPEIHAQAWFPTDRPGRLASRRGQFVVLEFWKTGCQHCRRSHAIMEELQKKYPHRVAVIGLTREPAEKVAAYLAEHKLSYPNGAASTTPGDWKVSKVPRVYLADPQGRLIYVCKPQELESVLRNALAGRYPICTDPDQVAKLEARLAELEERAARGDHVRVWADAFRIRHDFPITHPTYNRAKRLMIAQVKIGQHKLDRAKLLANRNKKAEARELLEEIIRDYEGALLEKEAERLLRSLDLTS